MTPRASRSLPQAVSKTQFKARALELFRQVERTRRPLVITDRGRPVLQIGPVESAAQADPLGALRGTVLGYDDPSEPVGAADWEVLR